MSLHIASRIPGTAASSSYQTLFIGLLLFAAGLYLLRQWLLPKPIPGIPHNPEATRSLLGDIMAIQAEMPENISEWVVRQSDRHRSPIYQVFLMPFSKPFVVVSDFREAQDILVRRGREFDRSDLAIALLRGEMPNFHACLKTGPLWSAHRRLLQDIMSPEFLNGVAAPNMYAGACRLLQLWRAKRGIAGDGVPFAANHDLSFATFDAIYDFGYGEGTEERALTEQIRLFDELGEDERRKLEASARRPGQPVDFPIAPLSPAMEAVLRTTENITKVAVTGFPGIAWRVLSWFPRVRRLRALKDGFIKGQVDMAIRRLDNTNPEDGYSKLKCALDLIIQRERTLAGKESREPVYWSDSIKDEMFGFVTGGHETSANVLAWGVKFTADHPEHQASLRAHLRAAHPSAVAESRFPSHDEVTAANVPFLLAYIEEILRLSHAAAMTDRQCTEDTVLLGHALPKGTTVVLVNKGPGYTSPSLPIQESLRSETSQKAGEKDMGCYKVLDEEGMDVFNPHRWLVRNPETGMHEFDATAYPTLPFGLGQRGCFGRRMVYVQFKQLLTLLVWQFEFLKCPEELSSYDSVQVLTNKPRKCYVALKEL